MILIVQEPAKAPDRLAKKLAKAIFSAETGFSCTFGAAGETCKETLLRKASEPTAHVAGFGMKVGGLRPSDASQGLINKLTGACKGSCFLSMIDTCCKRVYV